MTFLSNNKGIALITSLMFTVLALVISMALLYMVTSGTKTSGAFKRYRTAIDATYGGTELITKEMISKALAFSNVSSASNPFTTYLQTELGTLASPTVDSCFHERLTTPRRLWSSACTVTTSNPKNSPDLSFQLNATSSTPYVVYSKIVDTSEWRITSIVGTGVAVTNSLAGNSDPTSGGSGNSELSKGGTIDKQGVKTPHYPYIYRVEVQGERQNNSAEKGNVSVLYAY